MSQHISAGKIILTTVGYVLALSATILIIAHTQGHGQHFENISTGRTASEDDMSKSSCGIARMAIATNNNSIDVPRTSDSFLHQRDCAVYSIDNASRPCISSKCSACHEENLAHQKDAQEFLIASYGQAGLSKTLAEEGEKAREAMPTLWRTTMAGTISQKDVCPASIAVSLLLTYNANTTALTDVLCTILPVPCSSITLSDVTTKNVKAPLNDTVLSFTKVDYAIEASNYTNVLVTLLIYAQYVSVLSSKNITFILVEDSEVHFQPANAVQYESGDVAQCLSHYWYLIFFCLIIIIMLLVSQQCYYGGIASGRRTVRKNEQEIRAGQHIAAMMYSNAYSRNNMYNPNTQGMRT